ncbi:ribosome biogenesis protein NEP1, partial [Reticulomyxa filosa]
MTLLDSPLNKAGLLKVMIHTQNNVLIDVNPKLRIPRTYNRFAGLMVQLLFQKRIRALNHNTKLLKCVKHPIEKHLPPGAPVFGTSVKGDLVDIYQFVDGLCSYSKADKKATHEGETSNPKTLPNMPKIKHNSPVVF